MADVDQLVADLVDGRMGAKCCPEVDEILKRFQTGDATIEELRTAVAKKQSEIMR